MKVDSLDNGLASQVVRYMISKKYTIFTSLKQYNIVYIEGMDADCTLNDDKPNHFNDRRLILEVVEKPRIIGNWEATTEPGDYYTINPMNPGGAARIAFGQYQAWRVGMHGNKGKHEALVQVAPVRVHRDFNKDYKRTGDKITEGIYGINQHWGYDLPVTKVYNSSAGCLVGRATESHKQFMRLVKSDRRYIADSKYIFHTTIIPGDDLVKHFPIAA